MRNPLIRAFRDRLVATLRDTLLRDRLQVKAEEFSSAFYLKGAEQVFRNLNAYSFLKLGKFPNLLSPNGLNDRVQLTKISLFNDPLVGTVCDKVLFKDYVHRQIGKGYVAETLFTAESGSGMVKELKRLKSRVFLKASHDSGSSVLFDPAEGSVHRAARYFDAQLAYNFGEISGEWGYGLAQRVIICEKPVTVGWATDYKFYCVEGEIRFVHIIAGRPSDITETLVDESGNYLGFGLYSGYRHVKAAAIPGTWIEMTRVAQALSACFPLCRVDLYASENKVFVGEITLWPQSGTYRGPGEAALERYLT